MTNNYIEFATSYGPGYVVYRTAGRYSGEPVDVSQVVVRCPDNIIWDKSTGKWYPEPQVVDEVQPKAWAICKLLGIPVFRWLPTIRRDNIWAIEKEFTLGVPISTMMNFIDSDDYDGKYSHRVGGSTSL